MCCTKMLYKDKANGPALRYCNHGIVMKGGSKQKAREKQLAANLDGKAGESNIDEGKTP